MIAGAMATGPITGAFAGTAIGVASPFAKIAVIALKQSSRDRNRTCGIERQP